MERAELSPSGYIFYLAQNWMPFPDNTIPFWSLETGRTSIRSFYNEIQTNGEFSVFKRNL